MSSQSRTLRRHSGTNKFPEWVQLPNFDIEDVDTAILHIGPGNFWMANICAYIQDYMDKTGDRRWGFAAWALRSRKSKETLDRASNRILLVKRRWNKKEFQLLTVVKESNFAPENPRGLVSGIADRKIRVVTTTVTNDGYYASDAKGTLNTTHPDIVHDLNSERETESTDAPRTVYWYLAEGLYLRMLQAPDSTLTVMSLDNVPDNSQLFRRALTDFIRARFGQPDELLSWIDSHVDFRTTLVDRITPAVTSAFRAEVADDLGFDPNEVVVGTEFYNSLTVGPGRFEMPRWEVVGVKTVDDISRHWKLKFFAVNAAHQLAVALGQLLGYEHVHEAMADQIVAKLMSQFHQDLAIIVGKDLLSGYVEKIQERFADPAARDTLRRVGARGTSKASERILYAIETALDITDGDEVLKAATFVFACWLLNISCTDELGNSFEQDDAQLGKLSGVYQDLLAWTRSAQRNHHELAHLLRNIGSLCGDERFVLMAGKDRFVAELAWSLEQLTENNTRTAAQNLLDRYKR